MTAAQLAHLRLMSTLPVRTVPAKPLPPEPPTRSAYVGRPLEINGIQYSTLREAAKAHKVSRDTIYRWIRDEKARYIESDTAEPE